MRSYGDPLGSGLLLGLALVWGFAEATLFFIVPDVLLTYLVLFDVRLACWSCFLALIGALMGGGVMYHWGCTNFARAAAVIASLPGISFRLIEREHTHLREQGVGAIVLGPLKGVPYKIYAICASCSGILRLPFLLISIPARSTRFILSLLVTDLAFHSLLPPLSCATQLALLTGFWLLFYTGYFWKMGNFSR